LRIFTEKSFADKKCISSGINDFGTQNLYTGAKGRGLFFAAFMSELPSAFHVSFALSFSLNRQQQQNEKMRGEMRSLTGRIYL